MQNILKRNLFNQRGVTLIELIAVILILGIIAAVGIPVVFNQINNAETQADASNVAIMNDAIERYATMNSAYPTLAAGEDVTDLITTLSTNDGTGGPYIRSDFPDTKDADGTAWGLIGSNGAALTPPGAVHGIN